MPKLRSDLPFSEVIFHGSFWLIFLGNLLAVVVVVTAYFKWSYQYWKRHNIPCLEPSMPYGNLWPVREKTLVSTQIRDLYNEIKSKGFKHCGIYFFTSPLYFPVNLDYIKNILTNDFQHFTDCATFYNERDDPLSAHLFSLGGIRWRNLRTKLTPTFTSEKLKSMFQTLVDCEVPFRDSVRQYCDKHEPVDIKEMAARFTTDVIGSCVFGLDCNSFKEADPPLRRYGEKMLVPSMWKELLMLFATSWPNLSRTLRIRVMEEDVSDFFMKVVEDTVSYREKNNVVRKDFLQMLMELKNDNLQSNEHDGKNLTMKEVAAQSFLFFLMGFETCSATTTFAMYELAIHQKIQQKVRDEINEVLQKHDGKLTYDSIMEMKYMNQVVDETLRKYPPIPVTARECVKDYKVADADFLIEKGIKAFIPIYGIHHDPEYYPDPEKFDPERFSEEGKSKRHPYAYLPFGEGPRICIGLRFALMQIKVALASLLKNYKFTVNKKTPIPLKLSDKPYILAAEGDVWLDAVRA